MKIVFIKRFCYPSLHVNQFASIKHSGDKERLILNAYNEEIGNFQSENRD